MALKGLNSFLSFDLMRFLIGKRLVYVKAETWLEDEGDKKVEVGSKVTVQIIEDNTKYSNEEHSNFGEQLVVKVRGITPSAYQKHKPLSTEVVITEVEKAVLYGDYRNQLSVIAVVNIKNESKV